MNQVVIFYFGGISLYAKEVYVDGYLKDNYSVVIDTTKTQTRHYNSFVCEQHFFFKFSPEDMYFIEKRKGKRGREREKH